MPRNQSNPLIGIVGIVNLKPISATLEIDDDGTVIISDDVFCTYGAGDTPKEALNAYIENLTTYYEILEESISDEYPENEEYLDFMKGYILRVEREVNNDNKG